MSTQTTWWVNDRNPSISDQLTTGGAPVDLSSATVTFKMRGPLDGNSNATVKVNQPVTTKDSLGNWTYGWAAGDLDTAGKYLAWLEVAVGGKPQTQWEALIEVRPHTASHLYVEIEQLKDTLTLGGKNFADLDAQVAVGAASRAIDALCGRRFYCDADAAQVRYYSPSDVHVLEIDDLVTLTTLKSTDDGTTTFGNTWTQNTDFFLKPLNAATDQAEVWPYTHIRTHPSGSYLFNTYFPRSVQVTGKFGWAAVPANVSQAATVLATRLLKVSREAPMGVLAYEGVAVRVARNDATVMMLLSSFIRHRIAVA